jgi:hypothetical protein
MSQYACRCGCGYDVIDPRIDPIFQDIKAKVPGTKVNSACRCTEHNKACSGKANSAHLIGKALDVSCGGSINRYSVIKILIEHGVRRIGLANSFIHFDLDESKPQDVIFFY